MSKMEVIFENAKTRNRDSIFLDNSIRDSSGFDTEFSVWKSTYEETKKATEMLSLPGYGKVQKNSIKAFLEVKEKKEEVLNYEKTRWDIEPPSKEQLEFLTSYFYHHFKKKQWTMIPLAINAYIKGTWNRADKFTEKILAKGKELNYMEIINN